ncbi:MAG: DUF1553 domain-containing protein [Planctomycetia bacterium]|nr:DUF1553 domain-containing protein [Planctomycetia bacterium]
MQASHIIRRLRTVALVLLAVAASAERAPAADDLTVGVVRIEVVPQQVMLRAARETAQLIVTGYDAAGATRDLTHVAEIRSQDEALATVVGGRVSARATGPAGGRTTLEVRVGSQRQSVPFEAANLDRPDPVRFRSEVLPALTKQGCNAGSCHGAPEGKGGFALSMLAYKPSIDEDSLTTGGLARRVEPNAPLESLLLKKPLLRVTHVGGKRLHPTDAAYTVLRDWIAEGANVGKADAPRCVGITVSPGPARTVVVPYVRQQLNVVAEFADGTKRDVTRLATFDSSNKEIAVVGPEGLVTGRERGLTAVTVRYLDFVESVYFTVIHPLPGFDAAWKKAAENETSREPAENNYVDRLVHAKLKQLQFVPSELCDDTVFARRIHLDLTGLPPTAEQVREFLADGKPTKRAALIDRLLASEEFARSWAQKEADLYRVNPQVLDVELMRSDGRKILAGRAALFNDWLVDEWRRNVPYDRHVRELLTAIGDTHSVGPSNFFEAIPKQDDISEATAQLFMGSRINCAKCHNHPFESWTQDDYYRIVAVFTRVRQDNDTITVAPMGEATNPSTGKVMVPWGVDVATKTAGKPDADRRAIFTAWLTKPENPFFARVAVNRIWAHLLGRGIVHPVDDFRSSNPPANPELLDALAADFESHGYDRKAVVRTIANSRAYQRSTNTSPWNEADRTLFSHYTPRRLTGEQLRDAIGYASRTLEPVVASSDRIREREAELAARLDKVRSEQPAWEKNVRERIQKAPLWNGLWRTYVAKEKKEAAAVDLAKLPASDWSDELRWIDLQDFALELPQDGVRWFATELHVREAGSATFSLTTDAAYTLELDGRTVHEKDPKQRRNGGTKEIALKLEPGLRRMVLRVEGPTDSKKIRGGFVKWNDKGLERFEVRRDAVDALAAAEALPNELRSAVVDYRQATDGQVQNLRQTIAELKFRMAYHTQRPFPERSQFAEAFGQPKRESACACDRSSDPTLDQALNLLNGAETQAASSNGAARYAQLDDTALCDEVYLSAFARKPTDAERASILAFVKRGSDRKESIRDLLWALFNTREFLFQH